MPRIKFTADYSVRAKDGPHYKSGEVVEVNDASANHFINRGVAEIAKDEPVKSQQRTLTQDTGASDGGEDYKPANKRAAKSGGSKGSAAN